MSRIFTKLVYKPLRTKLFYIVLTIVFLTIGKSPLYSQVKTEKKIDTIKVDSIKKYKSVLEGKVKYRAKSYARFDQKKKIITLYDGAELYYQDYELKSGVIVFDYQKNEVYAGRLKDSVGNYIQYPVFKQGNNVVEPDSIRFNYKTKKALVWNSRTKQDELNIKAEISKKENDSVYFMKGVRITTAKDLDDPEYYFLARKAKLVPGKKVVVGFTNMYIAEVPTPIALPFAFFPITTTKRSGIILPSYGQNNQRGYALQNGGYYFALSDNYDLALLGDYFTNGSYSLRGESSYAQRYKFSGRVNVRYENQINSERGFPDYSKGKIFNIQWSHSKDSKSNPNSRFSASVNAGSSQYYQQSINQSNIGSSINNTLSSSISYQTAFKTVPAVNLSVAATQSQNTQTRDLNLNLPTLQASVERIYPFARKDESKKGFIKNINIQYSLDAQNNIKTKDSLLFKSKFKDISNIGFQHSIPLSTNFKLFKFFSATTSVNYKEVWALKTIERYFNVEKLDDDFKTIDGFDAFRTYSFSNSIGTTVYGTYGFKEKSKIKGIRHIVQPNISHSYAPSFSQYTETYVSSINGDKLEYTRFDGGIYGSPQSSYSNIIGFGLNNIIEAKVVDRDSTKTELKKVMLLNNLSFGTSYDLRTSRWSSISFGGGTALFKQKMTVNFGGSIDPYFFENTTGFTRNAFAVSNANLTMNYALASNKNKEKKNIQGEQNGGRNDDLFGDNNSLNEESINAMRKNDEEEEDTFSGFYNAEIPWDMNMALSVNYSNMNYGTKITNCSLMMSANTDLTPKWKIGISTSYDFVRKGVGATQLRLNRDLMSWYMNFNWSPFGNNAYWGFFIGIKASVLSDIKWDKQTQSDRILR